MKKFVFALIIIVLLTACSTPTMEEPMSVTYTAYLSESNSDYVGVYETSGSVTNSSYGYVGNNSSGTAFWLMFKLPANFPFEGVMMGDYESQAARVTGAILRLPEVNEGSRGSNPLTMKISPLTGAWNGSASWATVPAYKTSIVDTYSSFGAVPSSSNYDYRTEYHQTRYKYYVGMLDTYVYFDYLKGSYTTVVIDGKTYGATYDSTISAYYGIYIKYQDIDITNVVKDCIDNGATGLLLYFDTSNSTYNRKVFETILNSDTARQPKIVINFTDEAGNPPMKVFPTAGTTGKLVSAMKFFSTSTNTPKTVIGAKINTTGTAWKTIF